MIGGLVSSIVPDRVSDMTSRLSSLGYNASGKVYNAMATRLPTIHNPMTYVQSAAAAKVNAMMEPQIDRIHNTMASYMFSALDEQTEEEEEQTKMTRCQEEKLTEEEQLDKDNFPPQPTEYTIPQNMLAFSAPKSFVAKLIKLLLRMATYVVTPTQANMYVLVVMAMTVGVAMIALGLLGTLVMLSQLAIVNIAILGILIIIGVVISLGVFSALLLIYRVIKMPSEKQY